MKLFNIIPSTLLLLLLPNIAMAQNCPYTRWNIVKNKFILEAYESDNYKTDGNYNKKNLKKYKCKLKYDFEDSYIYSCSNGISISEIETIYGTIFILEDKKGNRFDLEKVENSELNYTFNHHHTKAYTEIKSNSCESHTILEIKWLKPEDDRSNLLFEFYRYYYYDGKHIPGTPQL